ncbi:lytic transglycosylase domain-containing protein [Serratia ficaria]|uniref:lytic transglycosylase domain-containing protein n=1 Tax=Serratia ficaria TaxID=61651 RepID=UPI00077CD307|nr:transglycosylase SLT domain-containing protein [Serratia ficaria]
MFSVSSPSSSQPQFGGPLGGTNNLSDTLSQKSSYVPRTSGEPVPVNYDGTDGTDLESLLASSDGEVQQQLKSAIATALLQLFGPLIQALMSGQNGGQENKLASNASGGGQQASTVDESVATPIGDSGEVGSLVTASGGDLHLPEALKPYQQDIQNAADKTGVPAEVLAAQIWQESRGNLGAATVNGGNGQQDSGLMQVNSNTFADLQSKNPDLLGTNADPNNARDNIMAGALYMKEQLNAFDGNMGAALRAYNSGPNNVNLNDLSDISQTGTGDSTYVDKVMSFAQTIRTGQGQLPA